MKTVVTMTPERWRQIEEIYHAALECEPPLRAAYVAENCGGDQNLIQEVKSLLARDASDPNALLNQSSLRPAGFPHLARGTRLGPYEIEAPLGSGGMGEVYLARDTRLKREVALKVLPHAFAADPERMARFEREACLLASLNHPNIAQVYGVDNGGLAMELVKGESPKGPMPFAEAWKIVAQIAEALEYAHEKGIVHRDLKPANIKITSEGVVKLLDFGLAKFFPGNRASQENGKASSQATPDATMPGVILGTGAYMPPEQAMGKSVDQRADIWAFGVILYELLTGRRPFRGDDLPQIIASVIGQPPDLTPIPPRVRPLVKRCLEKDPRKRLRHIGDAGLLLADETATATRTPRSVLLMGALAMVAVALAAYSLLHDRGAVPLPPQPARMSVLLPEKSRVQSLAVSPDGREIAMVLVKEGKQQIWVRPLEALEATPLAGTDDATNPFWSPDSQYIAFFADARLKKVGHSGGPVQVLCDALGALGGTWNRNGDILIGALARVEKVSASGGNLSPLPKHAAVAEFYPVFLPDGQHYLAIRDNYSPEPGVWLSSTDGPDARRILPDVSNVAIVEPPSGSHVGQVLFTRANTLMALPFDMKQLKTAGDPFPVAQSIAASSPAHWLAAASGPGVLAYVSGQHGMNQYVWRDRRGKVLGVEPDAGGVVAISPDGKRLTGDRNGQVWVLEFGRDIATRLTFGRGANNPIWSSDGRYVAYWSGGMGIYRKLANGAGAEEALLRTEKLAPPKSWSPDGRFLLYAQITKGASSDLMAIAVEPGAKPFAVADTPANEDQGQFSPDGHWVAYTSNESGVSEIYVVPFPPSTEGGKWLVSRGGGVQARWRRDGKELLYISPDSKMMSVEVNTQPVFQAGTPQPLFATEIVDTGIRTGPMSWDLAPDGNRFLIISESSTDASLTVALNWQPGPK